MSAEAYAVRAGTHPSVTDADLGLPQSPRPDKSSFDAVLPSPKRSSTDPGHTRTKSKPRSALPSPRLNTDLPQEILRGDMIYFPTPVAMDSVRGGEDCDDTDTQTVIMAPPPRCQQNGNTQITNNVTSTSPITATSRTSTPTTSQVTTPNLVVQLPPAFTARSPRDSELPPSPPYSAASPEGAMLTQHNTIPSYTLTSSTSHIPTEDRIVTTSLVVPARIQHLIHSSGASAATPSTTTNTPASSAVFSPGLMMSPLPTAQQLDECTRLLCETRAQNTALLEQTAALRAELADLRREHDAVMRWQTDLSVMLLMQLFRGLSCFPLLVIEWGQELLGLAYAFLFSSSGSSGGGVVKLKEEGGGGQRNGKGSSSHGDQDPNRGGQQQEEQGQQDKHALDETHTEELRVKGKELRVEVVDCKDQS